MQLGRVGAWLGGYGFPADDDRANARELERLGYGALWFGEAPGGKEAFTRAATLLGATESLVIATGIASIWGRDPLNTSSAIRTVGEAFPGRFIAGLGVSHPPAVEMRGLAYSSPLATTRQYVADMAAVSHASPEPSEAAPVVLAALRPKMLALSRDSARGAHPYFVPPEHTARAREILGKGAWLCPEQMVLLESDAAKARAIARQNMLLYLGLPNYRNNLKWLGFTDADFENGGSDRLVDAIVAWGDEKVIGDRIQAHLDAGADHVCIQVLSADGFAALPMDEWRRLAVALL